MRDVPVLADRRGHLGPVRLGDRSDRRLEAADLARRDRLERCDEAGVDHRLAAPGRHLDLGGVDELVASALVLVLVRSDDATLLVIPDPARVPALLPALEL